MKIVHQVTGWRVIEENSDTRFRILEVYAHMCKHRHTQVHPHKFECACTSACTQQKTFIEAGEGGRERRKLGSLVFIIIKSKGLSATSLAHNLPLAMHIDNIIILVLFHSVCFFFSRHHVQLLELKNMYF